MDTSETYINMCEKAVEIQAIAPSIQTRLHIWGNIYNCSIKDGAAFFWCMDTYGEEDAQGASILESIRAIWLPRRDQLREMVIGSKSPFQLSSDFYWWHTNQPWGKENDLFSSMEQLWLAFVMKENYNKIWNGEDWIEIQS